MSTIFLASVGLIALWEKTDKWHEAAGASYKRIDASRPKYTTTSYVLLECGNAAARKPYRSEVAQIRENLEEVGGLIHPTPADWTNGWQMYMEKSVGDAGIVDCVSFVVMRRLRLNRAFTNDQHFRMAGFEAAF